jgi:hypothetical protein
MASVVWFNILTYWNTPYMYFLCILNTCNLIPAICFYFLLPGTDLDTKLSKNAIMQWTWAEKITTLFFFVLAVAEIVVGLLLNISRLKEVLHSGPTWNVALAVLAFISLILRGGASNFLLVFVSAQFHHSPQQQLLDSPNTAIQPGSRELATYHDFCNKTSRFCSKVLASYCVIGFVFLCFIVVIVGGKSSWRKNILEKNSLWNLVYLSASSGFAMLVIFGYSIRFNRRHRKIVEICRENRDFHVYIAPGQAVPNAPGSAYVPVQTRTPATAHDYKAWNRLLNSLEQERAIKIFGDQSVSYWWLLPHILPIVMALFFIFTGIEIPS